MKTCLRRLLQIVNMGKQKIWEGEIWEGEIWEGEIWEGQKE